MRILAPLFLLVGVPALEIYLFVQVGERIGAFLTVLLTLMTMALGVFLIRYQGVLTLFRAREALMRGEPPAMALLEGLALLVSGFLLLIPGFFTDLLALLLFLPILRRPLIRFVIGLLLGRGRPGGPGGGPGNTIEGEYRREDDLRLH